MLLLLLLQAHGCAVCYFLISISQELELWGRRRDRVSIWVSLFSDWVLMF
jgi:hypothetical protein